MNRKCQKMSKHMPRINKKIARRENDEKESSKRKTKIPN